MANLSVIREICQEKNISLKELSTRVGITQHGLQLILKNNTTKIETLEKIAKILEVNILAFIDYELQEFDYKQGLRFDIPAYLFNNEISFLSNRYVRFSEIISFYKDYYLFRVMRAIDEGFIPEYNLISKNQTKNVILTDKFKEDLLRINSKINLDFTPFNKLSESQKHEINITMIFDGFYFPIFDINFKNITEYLEDGLINEPEINEYWQAWKSM